jgi:hypothetical protein
MDLIWIHLFVGQYVLCWYGEMVTVCLDWIWMRGHRNTQFNYAVGWISVILVYLQAFLVNSCGYLICL